ncbi:MAG: hypothetical protein K2Z81_16250, partial [Cyanobacteria bacterium]|nr:hypothetical protein [Cyanobacteriota bacterium]
QQALGQQTQYVFRPGSRQAVAVPAGQAAAGYALQGGGTRSHRGGMSVNRSGTGYSGSAYPRGQALTTGGTSSTKAAEKGEKRAYSFNDSVVCGTGQRTYHVYVPATYDRSRAMPLILVFHGLGMNGTSMTAVTGFNGIAQREGFIVCYGDAAGGRWDDGMQSPKNDVQYVVKMLTHLSEKLNIDQRRVYSVGLSNGGYFCQLLACSIPDKIAAIAVVGSTAMEGALSKLQSDKPMPAIIFAGTEDPLVNWNDDKNRSLGKYASKLGLEQIDPNFYSLARLGGWLTVRDTVDFWAKHNGSAGAPRIFYEPDKDPGDGMRVKKETNGSGSREVDFYTIEGDTHSWPGALYIPGRSKKTCQDISASEEIWKFFKDKSR